MIPETVEIRICRHYFRMYLPDEIRMEIEDVLLPYYLENTNISDDKAVKLAIDIMDKRL